MTEHAPVMAAALAVVGSINLDLTVTTERLPTPGETLGGGVLRRQPGGKGANQAVAGARLGGRVRMVGAVGNDGDGEALVAAMAAAGVDISGILRVAEPTGTALINVDWAGENQIVVCPGANGVLDLEGVEFDAEEAVLCQLEVDLEVVLEAARKTDGYFALNAAPAMPLPAELLERCDLIMVNETEYALIPELATARLVAVTYGKDGAAIFAEGTKVAEVPGLSVPVANTIGAGDAFCAALVLALRSGLNYTQALTTANAVGAAAVGDAASQPFLEPLATYQPQG
ncbi:ribokinase [Psychromicrobium xiongbiense]|uniref:ribokinase n=1 Tax=Psychromicrobium xiongbiense TaxID=3051184 RepID=UPI002556DAFE|nr:ribokinase [Psychromicrobium sp. YIM S02556]